MHINLIRVYCFARFRITDFYIFIGLLAKSQPVTNFFLLIGDNTFPFLGNVYKLSTVFRSINNAWFDPDNICCSASRFGFFGFFRKLTDLKIKKTQCQHNAHGYHESFRGIEHPFISPREMIISVRTPVINFLLTIISKYHSQLNGTF